MKNFIAQQAETSGFQRSNAGSAQEQIDQTLKDIHKGMTKLFHIDFPFFSNVKVIKHPEILNQLAQRIRDDFREEGMMQNSIHWRQINEALARNQASGLSEHFAFYSPRNDTLYMNETMVARYPEKVFPVCAHELAEKMLSTYVTSQARSSMRPAVQLYFEVKKTNNAKRLHELLNMYVDTIFKTVFKEGCCEALAIQTLRSMNLEEEAESLENELQSGFPKCKGLLSHIENARKSSNSVEKALEDGNTLNEQKLVKEVLKSSQIIKGVSYYLGYPLAKAVLEKYGIQGVRFSIESDPPLEAQYFENPQTYLIRLEKKLISKRREVKKNGEKSTSKKN